MTNDMIFPPSAPYDFNTAGRTVLNFLHDRLGFDLWMLTRTEGKDWIVLQIEDNGYGVKPNTVFNWADSMCSQMVAGRGPRIAPSSDAVPAYLAAPIGRQVKIGAYVGVPLTHSDGSLFGTLCAIHPTPRPAAVTNELPLIELLAGMLSSLLNTELNYMKAAREARQAETEAETDSMTGLYNRRGWDRLLRIEEERCRRYGHTACVLSIDLNQLKATNDSLGHAAGDELIRGTAQTIRTASRSADVVARTGGDEFVVLAAECDVVAVKQLVQRIRVGLERAGIAASTGLAMRVPGKGLESAWKQADQAMYREKARVTPLSSSAKAPASAELVN